MKQALVETVSPATAVESVVRKYDPTLADSLACYRLNKGCDSSLYSVHTVVAILAELEVMFSPVVHGEWPANGGAMPPTAYLRRNGWLDYAAKRRGWIDPETAQHFDEAEALRIEFKRRTGVTF